MIAKRDTFCPAWNETKCGIKSSELKRNLLTYFEKTFCLTIPTECGDVDPEITHSRLLGPLSIS